MPSSPMHLHGCSNNSKRIGRCTYTRGIHDGNMTGHPIVHMHILHINKEEVSHTKEGGRASRRVKVTPKMSNWHSSPK